MNDRPLAIPACIGCAVYGHARHTCGNPSASTRGEEETDERNESARARQRGDSRGAPEAMTDPRLEADLEAAMSRLMVDHPEVRSVVVVLDHGPEGLTVAQASGAGDVRGVLLARAWKAVVTGGPSRSYWREL